MRERGLSCGAGRNPPANPNKGPFLDINDNAISFAQNGTLARYAESAVEILTDSL